MRTLFLIAFSLTFVNLFSQDTTVTWLTNIDTTAFIIKYNKKAIPKNFYNIIGVDNLGDIASANKPYRQGCVGNGLPGQRLNWIAKDNKDHWVLSVSFGGRFHGTKYIYIDHDKNELNINGFYFFGEHRHDLTLGATTAKIKSGDYHRIDPSFFAIK